MPGDFVHFNNSRERVVVPGLRPDATGGQPG
jgi:hypothetical protein